MLSLEMLGYYHAASDTPETLDYPRLAAVTAGLAGAWHSRSTAAVVILQVGRAEECSDGFGMLDVRYDTSRGRLCRREG